MSAPLLQVQDLSGYYGPVPAVREVSIELRARDALAVVGSNGAGKSTLLKAMLGHVRASGEVLLEGRPLTKLPPASRYRAGLGLVPQEKATIEGLTVLENIRLSWLAGRKVTAMDDRVEHVLRLFPQLRDRLDVPAANLSGGQRQMLAVARGLALDSHVLLLDEPTAGLSPRLALELGETLGRLRAQEELAIVLVEQNAAVALEVCDRVEAVAGGEIVWRGQRADVGDGLLERLYLGDLAADEEQATRT